MSQKRINGMKFIEFLITIQHLWDEEILNRISKQYKISKKRAQRLYDDFTVNANHLSDSGPSADWQWHQQVYIFRRNTQSKDRYWFEGLNADDDGYRYVKNLRTGKITHYNLFEQGAIDADFYDE